MVIYALSRRRRDAAFTAAASGPAAPDAPPCHVDPTAPFLGRAAHGSVAAAVAAVRGASGAEAAVLRVAAFRQRPSLSPTLLLPAAVEEAPVAGGAAMAGPPDAAVTAVYAVPSRADLNTAQSTAETKAETDVAISEADTITVLVQAMGDATPVNVIATPGMTLHDLLDDYVRAINSQARPSALKLFFRGHVMPLERTVGDYSLREGSRVFVMKAPGTG